MSFQKSKAFLARSFRPQLPSDQSTHLAALVNLSAGAWTVSEPGAIGKTGRKQFPARTYNDNVSAAYKMLS